MSIKKIPFLILSFIIAIWLVGGGDWIKILTIVFYTFWLSGPILIEHENEIKESMLGYAIWVIIQVLIYRWGIGPPEGMGVPHF